MRAGVDREAVREGLECLHDNLRLAQTRLADSIPGAARAAALEERAELVRSALLEALESLRPKRHGGAGPSRPGRSAFGSPESRSYDVLTLRYLESMSVAQIEDELALGRRQIYRDLEEAEEKLAKVLDSWASSSAEATGERPEHDSLSDELLALASNPARVELDKLAREALALVAPLAEQAGAKVTIAGIGQLGFVLADRAMLKQVLVQLLCCAIQSGAPLIELVLSADADSGTSEVAIRFTGDVQVVLRRLADAQRIAEARGIACALREGVGGSNEARLRLPSGSPVPVLVVEDNPGAVELYRRYLSSGGWQVHSVSDPRLAFDVATKMRPDVIVLDVMMPWLDGWSVLQTLRERPETAGIPVLICSVVEQPELGAALGAQAYLTKPVSQGDFLAALRSCVETRR